jgi:hypothetical protein
VEQQTQQEPEFAALIGIDWADMKHYGSLSTEGTRCPERGTLDNTPEAVEVWMMELRRRFDGRPIAIALEQRKGALVVMPGKYEHAYLYPVNPASVAKFRQAWYPSGTKNDALDADLLREVVMKHREHLRRLDPDIAEMRQLQFQVENRRKLVDERTALANKLKDRLKIYFPQIPLWFEDVSTELVCDLLAKWPTLEDLRKARPAALEKFFHQHRSRNEDVIGKRVEEIRNAVPATPRRGGDCFVEADGPCMDRATGRGEAIDSGNRTKHRRTRPQAGRLGYFRFVSRRGGSNGTSANGGNGDPPRPFRVGSAASMFRRNCTGSGGKWQQRLDSFPSGVSQVRAPDVP